MNNLECFTNVLILEGKGGNAEYFALDSDCLKFSSADARADASVPSPFSASVWQLASCYRFTTHSKVHSILVVPLCTLSPFPPEWA